MGPIKAGVMEFVNVLFTIGKIPNGCSTTCITLIPKVDSPMVVTIFRPLVLYVLNIRLFLGLGVLSFKGHWLCG